MTSYTHKGQRLASSTHVGVMATAMQELHLFAACMGCLFLGFRRIVEVFVVGDCLIDVT